MITIITGTRGIGKTNLILKFLQELKDSGRIAYGIITPPLFDSHRIKIGFSALNVSTGEKWELARTDKKLTGPTYGPFHFSNVGFTRANEILSGSMKQKKSIIFLDEIGPLELKHQKGYYPSLPLLAETGSAQKLFIVIRPELIERFANLYFPGVQYRIITVTSENRDHIDISTYFDPD